MKNITFLALFILNTACFAGNILPPATAVGEGDLPQVSMDTRGIIRLVFGRADSIFCAASGNAGTAFSKPVFVGHVAGMHLGNTRGPQIASSADYTMISAMDQTGNIHCYRLKHNGNRWEYKGLMNDLPGTAPEGLMSLAADNQNNFYAVWLDVRQGKHNNICFSSLKAGAGGWQKSKLIYTSPDGHVCECCKPSITVSGNKVAVMFRNWLNGSRDLYVQVSDNGGKSFGNSKKLGSETWKLNGCPMDGGSIRIDKQNAIHTTWQRAGKVYYCVPGTKERELGTGRACSMPVNQSYDKNVIVSLQHEGNIKLINVETAKEELVGKGAFLQSMLLPGKKILCVWEQDKMILTAVVVAP